MAWMDQISGYWVFLGAGIMLLSCGITSYANILMKMDAIELRDHANPGFIMFRKYVVLAVSLYVVGGIADLVSLGIVPLSLRACASVLTIPFNAVFAKVSLNESMSPVQIIGSVVTVMSCLVAMIFAAKQENPSSFIDDLDVKTPVIDLILSKPVGLLTAVTLPLDLACLYLVYRHLPKAGTHAGLPTFRGSFHRIVVLMSATYAASYQTAWTNLIIKCIAMIAQESFMNPTLWVLVTILPLSAIAQMVLMSSIMRLFETVVAIPPYQIAITVWLVVFSAVAFEERVENLTGFVFSLLISFFGIFLVAIPSRRIRERTDFHLLVNV